MSDCTLFRSLTSIFWSGEPLTQSAIIMFFHIIFEFPSHWTSHWHCRGFPLRSMWPFLFLSKYGRSSSSKSWVAGIKIEENQTFRPVKYSTRLFLKDISSSGSSRFSKKLPKFFSRFPLRSIILRLAQFSIMESSNFSRSWLLIERGEVTKLKRNGNEASLPQINLCKIQVDESSSLDFLQRILSKT